MPTVFTSTLIGYTPHALDLERTEVVTPIATPDMTSALTVTVTSITSTLTNFISLAWPALLGIILLILFIVMAVRIGVGSVRKLGGVGRRA
jgi:hypothetical protein